MRNGSVSKDVETQVARVDADNCVNWRFMRRFPRKHPLRKKDKTAVRSASGRGLWKWPTKIATFPKEFTHV